MLSGSWTDGNFFPWGLSRFGAIGLDLDIDLDLDLDNNSDNDIESDFYSID